MTLERELIPPCAPEKRVAIDDKTLATLLDDCHVRCSALTEVLGRRNY